MHQSKLSSALLYKGSRKKSSSIIGPTTSGREQAHLFFVAHPPTLVPDWHARKCPALDAGQEGGM